MVKTYPTMLVLPDGATIRVRYSTPRRIVKVRWEHLVREPYAVVFSGKTCLTAADNPRERNEGGHQANQISQKAKGVEGEV